jgi:hypothetical protein
MPGATVNPTPLLAMPPTVTTTLPLVVLAGTGTTMLVALHVVGVASTPLNATVLVPLVAPKALPAIVTELPTAPALGLTEDTPGFTVKVKGLLATPPTVTTMSPADAPLGTGAVMLVALHAVGVAVTPSNVTVLVPWLAPKPVPVSVTLIPTGPDAGLRDNRAGATLNQYPLLARPPTVAMTGPVVAPAGTGTVMLVADHADGVAGTPLKVSELVP